MAKSHTDGKAHIKLDAEAQPKVLFITALDGIDPTPAVVCRATSAHD